MFFKLSAIEVDGEIVPKIKISDNVAKTTIPGFKQLYRFYDENNMALADVITLHDEEIDETKPYTLFHPMHPWKQKIVENYKVEKLLVPIFEKGQLVYDKPSIFEIRKHKEVSFSKLWKEVIRLKFPHVYYVDLSQDLWDLRQELVTKHKH